MDNEQLIGRPYRVAEDKDLGDIVVVQPALPGTHLGPLSQPFGALPATGRRMDVFELSDGKIKRFDCYPSGTIVFSQLGINENVGAAVQQP